MPSIDVEAKASQMELSARVGQAIQKRRKVLKLTAQQLAQRTIENGYPVTRVAISKIEANVRAGKLDVAELLALAKALEMPPALLLFPDYPDAGSVEAVSWISGRGGSTKLVDLVEQRAELFWESAKFEGMLRAAVIASGGEDDDGEAALKQRLRTIEDQQARLEEDIRRAKSELWGES